MKSCTGRSPSLRSALGRTYWRWSGHSAAWRGPLRWSGSAGCRGPRSSDGPCLPGLTWLLSPPSYEVQLESKVRRKGLGKFLIQILQLMANSTQMKKVMLTVFKHNHGAYQFFREALQFEIDDSSPSMSGCCGEDCSYEILSRRTKFGDSQHSHAGGHCGGCCH